MTARRPASPSAILAVLALVAGGLFPASAEAQEGGERTDVPSIEEAAGGEADPGVESARNPALEERVRKIAASIRCPVCLNLSIETSPSELARDMKAVIRERLRRGESPEEIRQYFVDRYGEWVLMTPEPEGLNLALWIVPALALLGGGLAVGLAVRRWVRRGAGEASGGGGGAAEEGPAAG